MLSESFQLHFSETVPNTAASFHGCSCQCPPSLISGPSDVPPGVSSTTIHRDWTWVIIEIDEIESAVDIPTNGDNSPVHMTYQFGSNCHVYMNSFNTCGVKVENSGNYAPYTRLSFFHPIIHYWHILLDHGGTALNENPFSSSKLSRPELSIRLSTPSIVSRLIDTKTFRLILPSNRFPLLPAQTG